MTDVISPPIESGDGAGGPLVVTVVEHAHHEEHGPTGFLKWITSTDHKVIGMSYMITSLVLFYIAGVMALVIRLQLASPQQLARLASTSTTSCSRCTAA